MKSLTEHLWFNVPGRRGFVNITATVEELVRKSGVREGLCLVNAMHITVAGGDSNAVLVSQAPLEGEQFWRVCGNCADATH